MILGTIRLAIRLAVIAVLLFALAVLTAKVSDAAPRCFRIGFGPVVCVELTHGGRCAAINARGIYTKQCPVR